MKSSDFKTQHPKPNTQKPALLIVGHGSRQKGFDRAMKKIARILRQGRTFSLVSCAYFEIAKPHVSDAIDRLVKKGAGDIRVLPYFLQMGFHVRRDMPRLIKEARRKYAKKTRIRLCPYIGYDEKIMEIVLKRAFQK